jgi:ABC-2 type transport system permease protein
MDLAHSQVINVRHMAASPEVLLGMLRRGEIKVGIVIPADFERRLLDGRRPAAQILIDGSDPIVLGVANQLAQIPTPRQRVIEPAAPLLEIRNYFNPERRSAVNTVPGLIGVILTLTMVLFTAIAIVRERERGNLEFLIATPVHSAELMVAKILPYLGIGLIQVTLILWLGDLLFAVPIEATLLEVYLATGLFIAASLALGLVISTAAKSQFQAIQMTIFLLLPSILISGFVFPFDGMPKFIQYIAEVLPMTHFIRLIKGLMLRGATLAELSTSVAVLGGLFVGLMTVATLRFRKRLD